MNDAVRAAVSELFDYAGLFPPAALPMNQAVSEFAQLANSEASALMRRFVCPVHWLEEFWDEAHSVTGVATWPLTVLGSSIDGFRHDLTAIEGVETRSEGRVEVGGFEVKSNGSDLHPKALRHLADAGFDEVYVELPWNDSLLDHLHALAAVEGIGAKVRMGGLEPSAYPKSADVAAWLAECVNLGLEMKMTAGLHHPIRHRHATMPVDEYGFLNVVAAGALCAAQDLNRSELVTVLEATQMTADAGGLRVGEWSLSADDLDEFRHQLRCIGSCSIVEPMDDLKTLGWW